jgi:hypothetical protein
VEDERKRLSKKREQDEQRPESMKTFSKRFLLGYTLD